MYNNERQDDNQIRKWWLGINGMLLSRLRAFGLQRADSRAITGSCGLTVAFAVLSYSNICNTLRYCKLVIDA